MKLHDNKELFQDTILAAERPVEEGGLGIKSLFIEKDYWITRALKLMATNDSDRRAVFKGGTSLSKVYKIGSRFSEDIDVAITDAGNLKDGQKKKIITRIVHSMSSGLEEIPIDGQTRKSSKYRKEFFRYPRVIRSFGAEPVKPGQILIEVNTFANPYPFEIKSVSSFIYDFLLQQNAEDIIDEYELQPFLLPVLDKRRTFTEKMVSLMRYSLAQDYIKEMAAKIRHFYDIHFLINDAEVNQYFTSDDFLRDFTSLFTEDQERFEQPDGWQNRSISESPLFSSFDDIWTQLGMVYSAELPGLAYTQIPSSDTIKQSLNKILTRINVH